jgi:hypothetical protein
MRAAERFAEWRQTRELGTRIPDSLWKLAVKFARTHGVCRTASMLRLDYYSLKRRLESQGSPSTLSRCSDEPQGFVELPASTLATSSEFVMELESTRGAKMRVHLKGVGVPDLAALSRGFWDME